MLWDFVQVRFCPVGFCPVGFCPVGFCPVGFCPDTRAAYCLERETAVSDTHDTS